MLSSPIHSSLFSSITQCKFFQLNAQVFSWWWNQVSFSSLDVGVVPESTTSEVSVSHPRPPKGTIDLFSSPPIPMPTQLSPMDREARVLRYREKKKARKFEKTIRYASRKAYAETRPRIRGRFAKRTDVRANQMFSSTLIEEGGYGIVPSFWSDPSKKRFKRIKKRIISNLYQSFQKPLPMILLVIPVYNLGIILFKSLPCCKSMYLCTYTGTNPLFTLFNEHMHICKLSILLA